jgi:hypothetical protein
MASQKMQVACWGPFNIRKEYYCSTKNLIGWVVGTRLGGPSLTRLVWRTTTTDNGCSWRPCGIWLNPAYSFRSQHVPFKFPMGSHHSFLICFLGSQCVPQGVFPIALGSNVPGEGKARSKKRIVRFLSTFTMVGIDRKLYFIQRLERLWFSRSKFLCFFGKTYDVFGFNYPFVESDWYPTLFFFLGEKNKWFF